MISIIPRGVRVQLDDVSEKCLLEPGTVPCVSRGTNNRVAITVVIVTVFRL